MNLKNHFIFGSLSGLFFQNHKEIEKEEGGESGSGLGILTSAVALTWNERSISILILQPSKER